MPSCFPFSFFLSHSLYSTSSSCLFGVALASHCGSVIPQGLGKFQCSSRVTQIILEPLYLHLFGCSNQSLFRWYFQHAIHLQACTSNLLMTWGISSFRLPLPACCHQHKNESNGHQEDTATCQRNRYCKPWYMFLLSLFLQREIKIVIVGR